MRQTSLDMIYELAKKDQRVFFIGSDLGKGTLQKFKDEMPDRFFMEGVSEANIVGMAAGLAMEGKIPYINTIATFLTRRCFEQIVLDLCLHHVNVRLLGSGGGLVYAPLGPTHQAIDDLSILRAIPKMTIVAPCDANEMKQLMLESLNYQGPIYIRIAKGGDPIVSNYGEPFKIGKAFVLREGSDVLLLTTGVTLTLALEAAEQLQKQDIEAAIVHVPTIKPVDCKTILHYAANVSVVITIEENTIIGGLGGAVAEIIAEANFQPGKCFKRIGIPDIFAHEYGSQDSLMKSMGITAAGVVRAALELMRISKKEVV